MKRQLIVLGTTDYTEVFIDSFESLPDVEFTGCIENQDRTRCAKRVAGLPVIWHEDAQDFCDNHQLICSLATTKRAEWINVMAERGFAFATLVHSSSTVSKRSILGVGASVDAGSVIAGFSRIGAHVRIGRCVSLGHHTEIGDFATIHPGSVISGNCRIGERVVVGTGSVIIDGISIGDGAVISAGSVVTRKVPARALVAGNPAVVVKPDYGPK